MRLQQRRAAFVGAALTEIAVLRDALFGRDGLSGPMRVPR
jgi:hypothetical protein